MPEGVAADAERTAFLASRDYRVPRFWNNDVLGNIEGTVAQIALALDATHGPPPLTPPHRKRGEGNPLPVVRGKDSDA